VDSSRAPLFSKIVLIALWNGWTELHPETYPELKHFFQIYCTPGCLRCYPELQVWQFNEAWENHYQFSAPADT
jgi:hypothetical protein